jgi:hypothetical protein
MPSIPQAFCNFRELINFCVSHGRILSGVLSAASSRAWTLASTRRSWLSSHKSCGVNWFSKQTAMHWPSPAEEILGLKGREYQSVPLVHIPLYVFRRNFAMGHILWGVTWQLHIFISNRSSAFFRVIRLICFVTQLTAVLHAGSLVSCHIFRSPCLYFNNRSRPGRSLFISKSVILLVDNLYAEAIEAVKSHAALSASNPELISTLRDISSEEASKAIQICVFFNRFRGILNFDMIQYVVYYW